MQQLPWSARLHQWWSALSEFADPTAEMLTGLRDRPEVASAFIVGGPDAMAQLWVDGDGTHRLAAESAARLLDAAADNELVELPPDRLRDLMVGHDGDRFATGAADYAVLAAYRRADGADAVIGVITAAPIGSGVVSAVRQVRDIAAAADSGRAERGKQVSRQVQDAILAEASLRMSSSLDIDDTLRAIVRMVVPAIADGAAVHIERNGRMVPVAVAHVDARREARLAEYLREGRWAGSVSTHGREAGVPDSALPRPADLPSDANLDTMATMVLRAHGREVGLLSVFHRQGSARTVPVEFLHNLAGRAALAVDNAALHDRQRRDMLLLQQHLLPATLPGVDGIDIASSYRVAEDTLEVGGDFYGAVLAPDARLHALIGDVCGRGAAAAALTGLARHTVETLLTEGHTVPQALHALNAKMVHEKISRFLTMAVASLSGDSNGGNECRAELFAAGHPRPMVLRRDGTVEEADCSGKLVGYLPELSLKPTTVRLLPGDSVLLYTDGLSEARDDARRFFEPELAATLTGLRALPPGELATALTDGVGRFRVHDDAAVLILRYLGRVAFDARVATSDALAIAVESVAALRTGAENPSLPREFEDRLRESLAAGIDTIHLRVCGDAAWTRLDITPAGPEAAKNGASAWTELIS
ncbi:PP2C family protein-serine/threonine phosphatase [Nocardia sp. NPDC058058]|uniref:PP2C family protein-serine/threonine phosphatase n=1 Tax=Nocardia sp. NPDC058058 TaxID=3346317 RepID=UPI0036D9660E